MKIKKGDKVIVLTGSEKKKTGVVTQVFVAKNKVLVEGLNLKKKHKRGSDQILEVSAPMDASNVALIDAKTKNASRVGYKMVGGKKVRITKASGSEVK